MDIEAYIQDRLFEKQDLQYKTFQCRLLPTVAPETIIGVRTPELRVLAKEVSAMESGADFMRILPHKYFDENNVHGFMIENIKDFDAALDAVEAFLPYVDNWATCDQMSPKIFKKHLPELYERVKTWLNSEMVYTVRFAIGMLLGLYLDDAFSPEMPELVAGIHSEEYYINMMIAWYFSTALCKQYDAVIPLIEQKRLNKWTHNKTIQKAVESRRISNEAKEYLKTHKIK